MLAPVPCMLALALVYISSTVIATSVSTTASDNSAIQVFAATKHVPESRQTLRIEPVQISVLTVTQFIIVGGSIHETSTTTGMARADSFVGLSRSTVVDPGANTASYKWVTWLVKPIYVLKAITVAFFSYVLVPAWVSLLWVARVLLFRPAVLIYLLFLERPFQAVTSLFMWILPLLSFAIVTTIFGTLIGGTFGWISAVAVGLVKAPADSSDGQGISWSAQPPGAVATMDSQPQASSREEEPLKQDGMSAEGAIIAGGAESAHGPDMWTRRRRSRNVYATSTTKTTATYTR